MHPMPCAFAFVFVKSGKEYIHYLPEAMNTGWDVILFIKGVYSRFISISLSIDNVGFLNLHVFILSLSFW